MTVIATRRRHVYPEVVNLCVWQCPECGIVYGIPQDFANACQRDGSSYYCPNGHSLGWHETDADRQKKRADAAERRANQAENAARSQRVRAEAEQRRASAYKGQATKIRNRIAAGVCPVPGCRRSGFSQVMRHIEAKHPSWAAEHVHGASGDE